MPWFQASLISQEYVIKTADTFLGQNKMAKILQTAISNEISWITTNMCLGFTKKIPYRYNWQQASIASDSGLVLYKRQAIT